MSYSPVLWRFTAREIQRRPGRTLLTLLGIVIGVASVVAIIATTRATRRSYREMCEAVAGRASLEVAAPGQGGFDPAEVVRRLRKVDGVETAGGMIQRRAGALEGTGVTAELGMG